MADCLNCKDSILNKAPTIIGSPLCNGDCPEDYVCLDIIQAGCVAIQGKEDCIENSTTVQGQINNIREYICQLPSGGSGCECPPNKYTINSVCAVGDSGTFSLNTTPLFTHTYPLSLFISLQPPSYPAPIGIVYTMTQGVSLGVPINVLARPIDNLVGSPADEVIFQVTDNKGNYSDPFTILLGDIEQC